MARPSPATASASRHPATRAANKPRAVTSVPAAAAEDGEDGFVGLTVHNASFLLDRVGSDCHPLQQFRELTTNGFQAVANLGPGAAGRIVWDVDWDRVEATNGRERKLAITDTGCGMSHAEMAFFINQLAATGQTQGHDANHGVGAKISAGYRNWHGVEYRSWQRGTGAKVVFYRDEEKGYGLRELRPGKGGYWLALSDEDKPWALRDSDHGTIVTLLGRKPSEDTTRPPKASEVRGPTSIRRYLNQRYFELPDGIDMLVREGNQIATGTWQRGELQPVLGHRVLLEQRAVAHGSLELKPDQEGDDGVPGATVRWWILDEDTKGRRAEASLWASTGHIAALFQDELYSFPPPTRGGYTRLQSEFAVRYGYERIVIYVEPHADELAPNTSRTDLLIAGEPLPWAAWGAQFRERMPEEIRACRNAWRQTVAVSSAGRSIPSGSTTTGP